jgi:hypothetical protein
VSSLAPRINRLDAVTRRQCCDLRDVVHKRRAGTDYERVHACLYEARKGCIDLLVIALASLTYTPMREAADCRAFVMSAAAGLSPLMIVAKRGAAPPARHVGGEVLRLVPGIVIPSVMGLLRVSRARMGIRVLYTLIASIGQEGPVIVQYLADQKPSAGLIPPAGSIERYRSILSLRSCIRALVLCSVRRRGCL